MRPPARACESMSRPAVPFPLELSVSLSISQRRALLFAWSDEFFLVPDAFGAVRPNTVRSLVVRGLLVPEDPANPQGEHVITEAGRSALGALAASPGDIWQALALAAKQITGRAWPVQMPRDLERRWFSSDEVPCDFSRALAVIDLQPEGEDELDPGLIDDDMRIAAFSCVGVLVREWGFDCGSEVRRDVASFWPDA